MANIKKQKFCRMDVKTILNDKMLIKISVVSKLNSKKICYVF